MVPDPHHPLRNIETHAGLKDDSSPSTGVRLIAAKDHVAAALAAENEPGSFEGSADFEAGEIGGKSGHVATPRGAKKVSAYAASISTNSLPASVGTGSPASRQSST
jgi:hypothetical protein